MFKNVLALALIAMSLISFSQENNLDEFVTEQNQKLVYSIDKLVVAPNTQVSLIPPEHFVADPSINGFVHAGSASTIQIIEVPGVSYNVIENSMTPEYIASQNYTFVEKKELISETNKPGVVFFVRFFAEDTEYERAMFFTGSINTTWVNINYPVSMKKLLYPAIEACLKSVQ